jgi:hypothetical protein
MSDTQRLGSPPENISADLDGRLRLSHDVLTRVVAVGLVIYCLGQTFVSWAEGLERRHHRAQLLAAYRRRHAWKKSDIPHLKSLGVNEAAQRRMERLTGRGRPVVKPLQPLDIAIVEKVSSFQPLFDPEASPAKRRQAFKLWPWWRHHVEALYRGEHTRTKEQGIRSPSLEAEISIGRTLGISAAAVHAICGEIRSMRKEDPESANFPAMTLAEYEQWMETGMRLWPD